MKPVVCVAAVLLCAFGYLAPTKSHGADDRGDFYVSLGYGPTIGTIGGLRLDAAKETVAVLPYIGKLGSAELSSANYDWAGESMESPVIGFENSSLLGLQGGVGCVVRGTRLEMEFGYERYDLRSQKYALLSDGSATFALVKRISASATRDPEGFRVALQKELSKPVLESIKKRLEDIKEHDAVRSSRAFADKAIGKLSQLITSIEGSPTSADGAGAPAGGGGAGGGAAPTQDKRAAAVAAVVELSPGERGVIGRAIATSTEGMEIVEVSAVRAISTVMSVCYDFPQVGLLVNWKMSPYACAGLGASFVGLTDRQFQPQLTCRLKAGINYNIARNLTAFIGGTFGKVLGTDYKDTPAHRAVDDASPLGRTKEKVLASFGLQHTGVEVGIRLGF
ncbi:P44/Msp2 family outer membrane protein [Anaplasma centrale]|nr:P44/Msp2 family outer membrane protein [Anaplasma centrale]